MIGAILRYVLSLSIAIAFVALSYILSPALAAWSVISNKKRLPGAWQWFSTIDDDLDGGQHQAGYPTNVSGVALWWQRVCWICRNPAYGWHSIFLGFEDKGSRILWENSPTFIDLPGNVQYGLIEDAWGRKFFYYRRNFHFTKTKYIALWIGWNRNARVGWHQIEFQPFIPRNI